MSIKINSNKQKTLKFDMELNGTKSKPLIRFILESNNVNYMFNGELIDNVVTIEIPKLNTIIEDISSGQYKSKVEVIVDNEYFESWEGYSNIENPVEIKISENNEEKEKNKIELKLIEETEEISKKIKKPKKKKIVEKKKFKKPEDLMLEID